MIFIRRRSRRTRACREPSSRSECCKRSASQLPVPSSAEPEAAATQSQALGQRSWPAVANDRLVPEEGVLDGTLAVVAGLLLPLSPSDFPDSCNRSVTSRAFWHVSSANSGVPRWSNDNDRPSLRGCVVDRPRVVCGVCDEASRRDAGRAERASCDLVRRDRGPSSRRANSETPRSGGAAG